MSEVLSGSQSRSSLRTHTSQKSFVYQFPDLQLSYQVRQKVYELLISFDNLVNYQFTASDTERVLAEILQENEEEIKSMVRSVFEFDCNHDGIITYEQFANFCVEQHFGEIAIQRLHRRGTYTQGRLRIMSRSQFRDTLQYCLSFIEIQPDQTVLDEIFSVVDLDQDGFITYAEYFSLLRQYFGSQSESVRQVTVRQVQIQMNQRKQPQFTEEINCKKKTKKTFQSPRSISDKKNQPLPETATKNEQKSEIDRYSQAENLPLLAANISRIVFHQLKLILMNDDDEMSLRVGIPAVERFLTGRLNLTEHDTQEIIKSLFNGDEQKKSYQELVEGFLKEYMQNMVPKKGKYPMERQQFVSYVRKSLFFVEAKPLQIALEDLLEVAGFQALDEESFQFMMQILFGSCNWSRKVSVLPLISDKSRLV